MSEGITVIDETPATQFTYGDFIKLKGKKVSNLECRSVLTMVKVFLRKFEEDTNILIAGLLLTLPKR